MRSGQRWEKMFGAWDKCDFSASSSGMSVDGMTGRRAVRVVWSAGELMAGGEDVGSEMCGEVLWHPNWCIAA
jgi:hypothetical protein